MALRGNRPTLVKGAVGMFRGHPTYWDGRRWRYKDNGDPVAETHASRPCGECHRFPTPEGHDPCIAMLPEGVRNACCGHGDASMAYIQYVSGVRDQGPGLLYE